MRKLLLGILLTFWIAPAFGQVCPAVAALPDSERRVAYSPSASTGPFSVTFALLGDSTDFGSWLEVWLNGVMLTPVTQWQLTIPAGTLATACRPIVNASVTLTTAATGTLQLVGSRRPRRTSQFPENLGVSARNLNQVITDITATNRETWDKINDVTGRALIGLPGESITTLPSAANRAGKFLGFDATGLIPTMTSGGPGSGNVVGPSTSVVGHNAVYGNTTGNLLVDGGGALNAIAYGADPTGVADSSAAWTAMLAALGANHCGALYFPAGKYRFNTAKTVTLGVTKCSLSIVGDGQDVTTLYWPSAAGGMTINYFDKYNSAHVRGLTFTTGVTTGGTALNLVLAASVADAANTAISDVTNVTMRGDDGQQVAFYWTKGLLLSNVSNVQIDNYAVFGASSLGTGMEVIGLPGSATYAVQINLSRSTFGGLAVGFIYNSYIQGVTIDQSNFTAVVQGITVPGGTTGVLQQLSITNSQFNPTTNAIIAAVPLGQMTMSNNLFFVGAGTTSIFIPASATNIIGNQFICSTPNSGTAIFFSSGLSAIVDGNFIATCATGVSIAGGVTTITVGGSNIIAATSPVVDAGSGNKYINFGGNFATAGNLSLPAIAALGDTVYGSAAGVVAKLAGNITAAKQYLSQTGNGSVSAAPSWATIAGADITGAALTKVDDTNVTLTLGGTPATALLRAASLTLGWTGQLGLTRGGTAASLVASNGGIVYSTSTVLAILSGTATARQMLQSGASGAPAWSTTTWPATTTINRLLWSSAANVISDLATANSSILVTDSSGIPSLSTTIPPHTVSGDVTINSNTTTQLNVNNPSGNYAILNYQAAGVTKLQTFLDNTGVGFGSVPTIGFNASTGYQLVFSVNGVNAIQQTINKSIVLNSAALATTATDGFLYIASTAGLPTGVPTGFTGRTAITYDTTNHKICVYDPTTPSWRCSAAM